MTLLSNLSGNANARALLALALASFGIGTTEFVIMGLLPNVAADLGVSIPDAGLLVSAYALSVALGSPFLALATARLDRQRALLVLTGVFILGNVLCATAPSYAFLMLARIVTALCHGAFFGLGAVAAATLVEPRRRAQAVAMMFAGLTVANVLGVPFGTALGEVSNWRVVFWAVAGIGCLAALAQAAWLPREIPVPRVRLGMEARSIINPQVVFAMAISILASAATFSVFTFIAPLLENVTGVASGTVTWMLFIFGLGLVIGNFLGARLGDWRLMPSIVGLLSALVPVLLLFSVTSHDPLAAGATVFVWGVLAFSLVSPLQMRVFYEAAEAPNLASTLNQGAFNIGNAMGAWIGGMGLTLAVPYDRLPWIGAGIAVLAVGVALCAALHDRRELALRV